MTQRAAPSHSDLPLAYIRWWPSSRAAAFIILLLGEMVALSALFSFEVNLPRWQHPVVIVRSIALAVVLAIVVWTILIWPRRLAMFRSWWRVARSDSAKLLVFANLCLFAFMALASAGFTVYATTASSPPWLLFAAYSGCLIVLGVSLVRIVFPLRFCWDVVNKDAVNVAIAVACSTVIIGASELSLAGWNGLANVTLSISHWLLSLYEAHPYVNARTMVIGLKHFGVRIDPSCSGYEGMALITALTLVFLWAYRGSLRFPHALALVPTGIVLAFLLNSVRIAALVSVGEHISPEVALGGFHSQVGWITCLIVSGFLIVLTHKYCEIKPEGPNWTVARSAEVQSQHAYILPAVGLMLATIILNASAPANQWLYWLKPLLIGIAVCWCWRGLAEVISRPSIEPLLIGLAVGAVWIVSEPTPQSPSALELWLGAVPGGERTFWFMTRALGTIVFVPLAEELFFRGALYSRIALGRSDSVSYAQLSITGLVMTSLLFGAMHERWVIATVAGAIFALAAWRKNRLCDAIYAHGAANASIFGWAALSGQWYLL